MNCIRAAQSSTDYCISHGGGRHCKMEGCGKVSRKTICVADDFENSSYSYCSVGISWKDKLLYLAWGWIEMRTGSLL
jgi:hypothetical protein